MNNNHPIKQAIDAADAAINCGDFEALARCYAEQSTMVVRPGQLVSGRSDIRDAHNKIADYFNGSLNVSQGAMEIIEAGNIALVLARTTVTSPDKPDSEYPSERAATYVYQRDESGQWLCVIDNSYGTELVADSV